MLARYRVEVFLLLLDMFTVAAAPFASLFVRFEGTLPIQYVDMLLPYYYLFLLVPLASFFAFRLYNRLWRYASLNDLLAIMAATIVGSIVLSVMIYAIIPAGFPRSIYFLNAVFVLMGIGGSRFAIRAFESVRSRVGRKTAKQRTLIIGAGDAGAMLARDIMNHGKNLIVGFVDDDTKKKGRQLFGVSVLGERKAIPAVVESLKVAEIWIAMPSASGTVVREILGICQKTACNIRTLPSLHEIPDCKVSVRQLREIRLEDLLRRAPVCATKEPVDDYLKQKCVLVTGAGGSIGSELCRQIATFRPKCLLLLGKGENSIYGIHTELKATYPELALMPIIADVRDEGRMESVFHQWRPQVVFHAAAHKHVPLMELQPEEAIRNNVVGTWVLAQTAASHAAERFILISTDKAVKPSSVMGATKRAAEILIDELGQRVNTKFAAVRFGNVLGSRGSVVPLFESQIAAGGPVTVTHPDMRRYFMTIPEAAELVLQAGAMAGAGGIFILDMGEPVRVVELAEDLIRLMGLEPYRDILVKYTGIRPGEKINEELFYAAEEVVPTSHPKIMRAIVPSVLDTTAEAFIARVVRCLNAEELFKAVCTYEGAGSQNRLASSEPLGDTQAGESSHSAKTINNIQTKPSIGEV